MNTFEAKAKGMFGAGATAIRARGCVVTEECVEDPREQELRAHKQYMEGEIEKRSRMEADTLQATQRKRCDQCAREMDRLFQSMESDIRTQLIGLALHISEVILHRELPDPDMLRRVLREALEPISDFQGVRVRLAPVDAALLRGQAAGDGIPNARGIEWVTDPDLATGDVLVESRNGLFDGRLRQRLDTLAEAMKTAVLRPTDSTGEPES